MSESLTHSFPRSFLVVAWYASAVGFADAFWLCPERALRRLFASVSLLAPVALSPLLHRVFPDGFRLWCAFRFCKGASPLALVPLSFALASGRDSTVLIPPAKDFGESPSFTVRLTPCYCGVLDGLHVLVDSLTSPSPGRLFEPSSLGRLLCLRLG